MSILRRKVPNHYIPIHRDNINKNDWIILVEAGTIVGPSAENEKLRVAQATLERKIVKKYNLLLRAEHYLVMDGYDPRIHALYFCPQLYRFIGKLVVQAVQGGVIEKRPWYEPSEELPAEPIINARMHQEVRHCRRRRPQQMEIGREIASVRDCSPRRRRNAVCYRRGDVTGGRS